MYYGIERMDNSIRPGMVVEKFATRFEAFRWRDERRRSKTTRRIYKFEGRMDRRHEAVMDLFRSPCFSTQDREDLASYIRSNGKLIVRLEE